MDLCAKMLKSNEMEVSYKLNIIETILIIVYAAVAVILIALALIQSKDDEGASGTVVGGASSSFYEKNKGRTKEGMLKKWTVILAAVFVILTIVLGIVYMLPK